MNTNDSKRAENSLHCAKRNTQQLAGLQFSHWKLLPSYYFYGAHAELKTKVALVKIENANSNQEKKIFYAAFKIELMISQVKLW